MSRETLLQLDSVRLAQYAVQAPCYVCSGGNNFDAELCRHCQAPMALAHQANTQKVHPHMVAVLGSAGTGKTVFLGMLTDMLSRQHQGLQMLARGAFSITLQQTAMAALARCEFPAKTPNEPERWNWVHCQVLSEKHRRPLELIMPDFSGEALIHEMDSPYSYPVIREFLNKCVGVLVLIDAARLASGEQEQDFFTMKMISYLCELDNDRRKGWPNRPVSFVFTKADQCDPCFVDPVDFARQRTPGLWQQCQERLRRCKFFASGVAGAVATHNGLGGRTTIPLRIEPRGIVEPFAWLVEQLPH
jgi:hypothetical protein